MSHLTKLKVRFSELDPNNHVNHAVYISYFEVARTEALEAAGASLHSVSERGYHFVVVELTAKFKRPARAGDHLELDTWLSNVGRASTQWSQQLRRGEEVLVTEELRVGLTDSAGKPVRPPVWLLNTFEGEIMTPPSKAG